MKILLATESYWPNLDGGALFERRLVHALIKAGDEVHVIAPGQKATSYLEYDEGSTICREKSLPLIVNPKYRVSFFPFFSVRREIRRFKPDVIHIHAPYLIGLAALLWGRHYNIPVVATNHFMAENLVLNMPWFPAKRFLARATWRYLVWFYNRVRYLVSPTETAVKILQEHGLKTPAKPISNGIDLSLFSPERKDAAVSERLAVPAEPYVLYLGRLDKEKRLDVLVRAIPAVAKTIPATFVFGGAGNDLEPLKALARELGVLDYTRFLGFVDEADKPAVYANAGLYVIPSPAELQSISTLEAMASGLPIIGVNVAALFELIHDGENGFLFEHENYSELAEKIIKLLTSPDLRLAMGQKSREIAKHHASATMVSEYRALYALVAEQ